MALTRVELDQGGCGTPGCQHDHTVLYLHGRCHPSAGARVSYDKRAGNISVVCRRCDAPIAEIAVASGMQEASSYVDVSPTRSGFH